MRKLATMVPGLEPGKVLKRGHHFHITIVFKKFRHGRYVADYQSGGRRNRRSVPFLKVWPGHYNDLADHFFKEVSCWAVLKRYIWVTGFEPA